MRAQAFTNTFSGGMVGDIDPHEQPNNTYRYAYGGRIIFNESEDIRNSLDENVKSGSTRAFANIKGNKFALSLCEGYQFIGAAETDNGAVIFSTNETYGEIGFLEINDNVNKTGFAKYTTLFNDRNDPNGDRLNFSIEHYITGSVYVNENQFTERIYFTDAYNEERVINLRLFYDSNGNPYHPTSSPCTASVNYPKYLSVHAFSERMDLVFPRIKFSNRIVGQLKSGQYQLLMKYVSKSGHSSVWSPDTRPVFVTDQKIDGDITTNGTTYANAYKSNHHNRTMGPSNVMTEEGLAWDLEGIDTRWDQIKVGYIYHINDVSWEANEFKTYDITGPNMTVNLNTHSGITIPKSEITQRFETVLSVGTIAQQENRIWSGDIELLPDMSLDLSGVSIKPTARYYNPDSTVMPVFTAVFNPVTNRDDNDPITNTFPVTKTVSISSYTGKQEVYKIVDDYENYKGQQFTHLFKAYFRGETQPFALVLRDRKGNPLFVQHMKDFTFPNQFDDKDDNGLATDWTLSKQNNNGTYDLRIMGAMFSNIQIPASILFDKFGKLNVSSFEIVRTKRIPRIANQGLLINTTMSPDISTDDNNDGLVHPMEYWNNTFAIKPTGVILPNAHGYFGILGSAYRRNGYHIDKFESSNPPGIFNYHSPDFVIEQAIGNDKVTQAQMLSGRMQKVGFVHKSTNLEYLELFERHSYSKSVRTSPFKDWLNEDVRIKNGRPPMGSLSRIKYAFLHDKPSIYVYEKFDPEIADRFNYRVHVQAFFPGDDGARKSTQQPYSVIMRLLDFSTVDSIEEPNSRATYPIANWTVNVEGNYGEDGEGESDSALNTRIYFSTGHFQPITKEVLNQVSKTYLPNGEVDKYVFNDVEVWGGDCYNNLYDFTRMYPEYSNCDKYGGFYPDYSNSLIVPIESRYNIALCFGRRFAANAVLPQQVSCGAANDRDRMTNGVMPNQPEGFDYNKVLLLEESVSFYYPKPSNDTKIVDRQESTIRWSPQKIYGELEDSYRQNLVSDYKDVDGSFGRIQKLVPGFDYLYVVQERAFGACLTRADRLISTDTGQLSVTSGSAISGIRYISKVYGSQHRNSITDFDNKIIFTDGHMGKIVLFSQSGLNPESESDLMNDPIAAKTIYMDQPIKHKNGFVDIIAGVDRENGDFLTTFLYDNGISDGTPGNKDKSDEMKSFTLSFNSKLNKWHFYHPFTPYNYFNVKRYLFSTNPTPGAHNQVFLSDHGNYGQWCGIYYPTILEFIVNPNASVAKVFDNGFINVNEDAFMRISKVICTVNKNVHTLKLASVINNQVVPNYEISDFMEDSLRFPLFEQDDLFDEEKERLRGHYMKVRLEIDNSQYQWDFIDKQCVISTFDTRVRVSSPHQYQ